LPTDHLAYAQPVGCVLNRQSSREGERGVVPPMSPPIWANNGHPGALRICDPVAMADDPSSTDLVLQRGKTGAMCQQQKVECGAVTQLSLNSRDEATRHTWFVCGSWSIDRGLVRAPCISKAQGGW